MATIHYDSFDSDLLKVRFKCEKHDKETALICPAPPVGEYSRHEEVEARCGCKYEVYVQLKTFATEAEIVGLPQENVMSWHPIWWEYYTSYNTEHVDWIVESENIKACMETVEQLDHKNRSFIYGMLWCKIISMMDAYCHHAIARRVLSDKEKWNIFYETRYKGRTKADWKKEEIETILQRTNFLSVSFIVEILDKVFAIKVVPGEMISHAVYIRNILVHTQGIGKDCEIYTIEKNKLQDLFNSVDTFISDINKCFLEYDGDKCIQRIKNHQ